MTKIILTKLELAEAKSRFAVDTWEPYDTMESAYEKWNVEGNQEAIYILEGSVTVKSLGGEFHLEPGHLIVMDKGCQFDWIVANFVKSGFKLFENNDTINL